MTNTEKQARKFAQQVFVENKGYKVALKEFTPLEFSANDYVLFNVGNETYSWTQHEGLINK